MCGIIGYIGKHSALPILIKGLELLEYRGYDSAGVVLSTENEKLVVEKCKGRIEDLKKLLNNNHNTSTVGLGHTRWATHGIPSKKNAHPHLDCTGQLAIVHNGIIENYQALKAFLIKKGHKFISDTDSEVIAHLIEEELKKSKNYEASCRNAFKKLEGSFAVGVISSKYPDVLIAARLNSPLIVGIGDNENFIASDAPAIIDRTKRVVYLDNNEIVVLRDGNVKIMNFDGKIVHHKISEIKWNIDEVSKGGFDKFMLKEIHEQPNVIRQNLSARIQKDKTSIKFVDERLDSAALARISKFAIVACGTAYHAGIVGRYLLEHFTNVPVEIDIASEFRYRKPKLTEDTCVLSVSQSGETADTLASIREAKKKGCYLLSICNVVGSTMARESDAVIYTHAGPEIGVASTKAYTAQLVSFCLFTIYLAQIKGEMKKELARKMIIELEKIPDKMNSILENKGLIKKCAEKYHKATSTLYLGRGFNYPSSLEGALKNKEISYIHAEGYPAGEMKHGPIALIDKYLPVICICTKGDFYDKMISNIKEVEARNGRIIAIATEGDEEIKNIAEDVIYVPETWDEFSPLLNAIPLQLFAYYTALARGCDIDKPRNLAKSVTVE